MPETNLEMPKITNPFDQILTDCRHDPREIQDRYETHRSTRNAQFHTKLLSPGFSGWQTDEILYKLATQATKAPVDDEVPFVDPRHNLALFARPPPHLRGLVAEIQASIRDIAPSIWFTPPGNLHMTVMEMASCRPEAEVEPLVTHLQQSGAVPELVDYTLHHRARLVKPMVSYDATAMALSFVPASGEGSAEIDQTHGGEDKYTYHHLRRDLFDRLSVTGLVMKPRYIVPSAHVTIARFTTRDGFTAGADVDHERVAALVETIEQINQKLRHNYWPQEDGKLPVGGEWRVGQGKGLELCKGRSYYGAGIEVVTGQGFL